MINNLENIGFAYLWIYEDFTFLLNGMYLNCIHVNKFRDVRARFMLSHGLAIERGRYTNINREDRTCEYCIMKVVENEYYFLLVWPKYRHLRKRYFKPYFCYCPSCKKA